MAKKQIKKPSANIAPANPSSGFWEKFEAKIYWQLLIIIIVPVFVYLKVVNFEFVGFDDRTIIYGHYDIIGNIKNIGEVFKRDAFLSIQGNSFYRPVQTVSFMLDAMASGKGPWMYHLSNLLIHLLSCIALYYFLRQLKIRNLIAFAFTLIFAVHPLFASAVSWVPSRGDLLIGLFCLLLFITFYKHIISGKRIYFFLNAALFIIAVFTKETIVVFPLLLLFYYLFVLNQPFVLKKLFPYFMVWLPVLVLYFIVRSNVIKDNLSENVEGINVFINNLAVIPITICKFFIPYNLSTFPLFDGIAATVGLILLAFLFYLTAKHTNKHNKLILFGLLWFLLFTLPGLFVRIPFAEAKYLYLEHRTYLVMMGIIIMMASFSNDILNKKKISLATYIGIVAIIVVALSTIASIHSDDYKDSMAFLNRAASFNNANAYTLRGENYISLHDSTDAMADFDKAIELSPDFPDAYYNRGKFEATILQHTAAENDFTKAISLDSSLTDAWIKRSVQKTDLQDYSGAINDLTKAIQLDSTDAEIYYCLGGVFYQQKKYKDAFYNMTKAITLLPGYADAYMNRGSLCYTMNDLPGAVADYKKAVAIKPGFLAYYNLGVVYNELLEPDEALASFDSSIMLSPDFAPAYFAKGKALQQKKDMADACKYWQQALALGYVDAKDTLSKYCKTQ